MTAIALRRLQWLSAAAAMVASGAGHGADERTEAHFQRWVAENKQDAALAAFKEYLQQQAVDSVVPVHQLLRTASDWNLPVCRKVKAPPYELAPKAKWARTVKTLKLLQLLRERDFLPPFEVVSAYRNPKVEVCAGGGGARHPHAGAFDLLVPASQRATAVKRLCSFYWKEGKKHNMGFSQYSSGRLHIDTVRYSTWGDGGAGVSSACL